MTRTAAGPIVAGHDAFAHREPQAVGTSAAWFESNTSTARTTLLMRLIVPDEPDKPFVGELALQSPDDPSLVVGAAELWDAPELVLSRFGDAEHAVLVTLRRASRSRSALLRLLEQARPSAIELCDEEVDDLLGPLADDLAGAGLSVQWPAEVFSSIGSTPVISAPQVERIVGGGLDLDAC